MALVPKPPRIPPDTNFSVSNSQKNVSQILRVSNELSFFNQIPSGQITVGNSIESITNLLKTYGLAAPDMTQQGSKLVGSGYTGTNIDQGCSVSLSDDGNTLVVGGFNDDSGVGATWIFTRIFGVWMQQGPKLVGSGYTGTANQGFSVSLSSDGNTMAVGGCLDNSNIGAAWIFTRTAGVWTQQGLKLVGTGYTGTDVFQGYSVSLSDDGNTLAVGGAGDDNFIGATWIFTRTVGVWTQQGLKLVGTGYTGPIINQGAAVFLSGDGNNLAIGGNGDDDIGATWIFTSTSGVWSQQGLKLVGTGYIGTIITQGVSVSLSDDGNTLAVGGAGDDNYIGATWMFTRSAEIWSQQGLKLVGTGYTGTTVNQGTSVSLSGDGNNLAVGGPVDDSDIGAAWMFTRNNNSWSQRGSKLVGTGYTGTIIRQGGAVSLSGDGNTLAVGGFGDDSNIGTTWVFTNL